MTPTLARLNRLAERLGTVTFDPTSTVSRYTLNNWKSDELTNLGNKGEDARRAIRVMLAPKAKASPKTAHTPTA